MASIEWTKKALKQLLALPLSDRGMVAQAVDGLASWPDCRQVKSLVNRPEYRLRAGRYRVLFTVSGGVSVIIRIEQVRKRDDRTYSASNH